MCVIVSLSLSHSLPLTLSLSIPPSSLLCVAVFSCPHYPPRRFPLSFEPPLSGGRYLMTNAHWSRRWHDSGGGTFTDDVVQESFPFITLSITRPRHTCRPLDYCIRRLRVATSIMPDCLFFYTVVSPLPSIVDATRFFSFFFFEPNI